MNFYFSQHCFLSHFTQQYPQLACLSTQPLYSHWHICFLCHLRIFHNKKHHLNLLSSITKALLTHTLASFWRKQSCCNYHWNRSLAQIVSQCECFMVGSYWMCHWKKTFWVGGCDGIGGLAYLLFCAAYWSRQPRVFRRLSRSCLLIFHCHGI